MPKKHGKRIYIPTSGVLRDGNHSYSIYWAEGQSVRIELLDAATGKIRVTHRGETRIVTPAYTTGLGLREVPHG